MAIATTRPELTPRQREVYDLIRDSLRRRGIAPAIREMLAALGIDPTQTNAVVGHLNALERKGYITRHRGLSRAIALVDEAPHPAALLLRDLAARAVPRGGQGGGAAITHVLHLTAGDLAAMREHAAKGETR